jgi:hypothetical protein
LAGLKQAAQDFAQKIHAAAGAYDQTDRELLTASTRGCTPTRMMIGGPACGPSTGNTLRRHHPNLSQRHTVTACLVSVNGKQIR